uniref:Uncharacterized protein n=1 Tax=Aegilops tauschii subsp. strangulata TaxID=200361 RepID=A0A453A8K5_AEGTS
EDFKSMAFTRAVSRIKSITIEDKVRLGIWYEQDHDELMDTSVQVIFETLRLATVVNGLLRKTTKDVEMNGEICLEINPTNLPFSRQMLS